MDGTTPIGLLGFGAFGRLAAQHLAARTRVLVHDPKADPDAIDATGASPASLEQAAACPVVVLAVPVQAIADASRAVAPMITEGALVMDVASVKILPVRWMLDALPEHAQVLGTHPLFGPQTAEERGGIAGEPIALCRARADDETYESARAFLSDTLGLRVIELDADEHDRQMASVQVITHLIGHAASELGLPELETGTLAYRRLLQMMRNTEQDAEELFDAIQRLNPHAGPARDAFLDAMTRTVRRADELSQHGTD